MSDTINVAWISDAVNISYVPNRYKANAGAELGFGEWADGSGQELYETFYRGYSAQIGRFLQVDPLAEMAIMDGGYVYGGNNPVRFTDYLGDRKAPGHYGFWPGPRPYVHRSYSYVDRNGNKWHHRDFMAGTGAEGIPYYLYQEAMSQIPDGGSSGGLSFEGGKWGLRFGYWVDGEDAHGHYNEEMKLMMGFSPFRIGWQYRQTYVGAGYGRYKNSTQPNTWIENTKTGLGAFDVAHGAKVELIEYAAKSSKSLNNLKYLKVAKDINRGLAVAGGALTVIDVVANSQIKSSNILDGIVTGISTIPGWGWAFGGAFYIADLITEGVTGESIGEHLDDAVGGALIEW